MSSTSYYEELLQRYLDGQCSAAEVKELYTWLKTSGSHRPLLTAMQREFEQVMNTRHEIPSELSDRIETRLLQDISREKIIPLHKRFRLGWAAAAAVLLLAGAIYYMYNASTGKGPVAGLVQEDTADIAPGRNKAVLTLSNGDEVTLDSAGNQVISQGQTVIRQRNGQLHYAAGADDAVVYNTLTVPRGGQFNIILPDGSHVWLNAASSLKYPTAFKEGQRMVELQGQGYFEVSPNAKQPFFVKVNNMEVLVLGTRFDVMAYPDENSINTTLIEGLVKVNQHKLQPGQQAVLDPATGAMTIRAADVEQVIAWKTGFFEFDNARLSDILRQLSRWYDIDISYNQEEPDRRLGGRISRNLPLSDILHMLEENGPKFTLSGRKLTVTSVK
ncbi:MAG TPA: FecR domain-containing protein [Chitinophaga sp.]|nr:FecR domain-containing protein [Chitinophaga sp.]